MLTTEVLRAALPSLILVLTAGLADANAMPDCADTTQEPVTLQAACDATLEVTTDSIERARVLIDRAAAHRRQMNLDEAMADLAEAERLVPEMEPQMRADLLVQRSEVYRVQESFDAALADIEEAEQLAPSDADPVINRGLLLMDQGDAKGGLAQLARARELEPDHPRAHLASMLHLYEAGELETCVESGNKLVDLAPADVRIWSARGLCLAELGRTEEALADLQEAERLGSYNIITYEDMAYAYLALDRPEEALVAARQMTELDPMHEGARTLIMRALVAKGATDEAIAAYHEAQAAGIEDTTGLMANDLAWTLYVEGHPEKALPFIEEGLAKQTEPDADSVDTHAHILTALGRTEEAVQAFRHAAELSPEELRPMYEEGLTRLGHTPEPGEEGFEAALQACVSTGAACRLFPE